MRAERENAINSERQVEREGNVINRREACLKVIVQDSQKDRGGERLLSTKFLLWKLNQICGQPPSSLFEVNFSYFDIKCSKISYIFGEMLLF